jgi:hypothetical protein
MNIANHLLPCPFCNSNNLTARRNYVECNECQAYGPDADTEKGVSAIDAWNHRATES